MSKIEIRIEALEAELQKLKNEVKAPKMDANKWYWFGFRDECDKRYLMHFDYVGEKGYFYKYMINTLSDNYLTKENDYISKSNKFLGEATHQEVEEALIKEAKKRGFKHGVMINHSVEGKGYRALIFNDLSYHSKYNWLCDGWGNVIWKDGVWAEIVKDEPIKIGGYEVKKNADGSYDVGCKKQISRGKVSVLSRLMTQCNFKKVSFDGVETDLETINKILAL